MGLIENLEDGPVGQNGVVPFALFDRNIGLMIEDGSNLEFAKECTKLLNDLSRCSGSYLQSR